MNLIDCYITKILGEPYRELGAGWDHVEYDRWGSTSKTRLMFRTEEAARAAQVGYHFTA
ncbi:TPA: hypothetical protein SLP05_004994 [Pseudomonas putida]|jgi:hypothetical protein|uniref:hypothetical protein n=1 Tax=Pseudomonas TaxID=286 RepID=UPI000A4C8F8B|nr:MULTISPECIES: hypothetical protein [Pseudomonas]EKT4568627.1 hypothetical protein [Pseudomonas putida]MCE0903463.1 hypothetical protein [Pseudomonas alloputida]MCE1051308.1 hypothetical protein [Pseudomonas alloputida]MCF1249911.1 hypothetical protein [Pseudomonas putida]MDD2018949.1 hypothetical protein [Pseudomonas putida]